MTPSCLIAAALAIPLIGTVLIVLTGARPNLREAATLMTAVALFAAVVLLVPEVYGGGRPELRLWQILPGLEIVFTIEPLGMMFACIASGLWIVNSIYSFGYMRATKEAHQTRFYACFAIAIAAAVGVAMSGNMLTLFVCYEVLTLSTYPLVVHRGDEESIRSGRVYIGILLTTSILFLLGAIVWTFAAAGTLDFKPGGILDGKLAGPAVGLMLFLYMYGIGKAALMPVHRWLPAAMVAPTPVSALLHAVAVVKAGVFTVLKVIVYLFGADFLRHSGYADWLMYAAAASLLLASCIALTKDNLKARLAYSTVSQLAYVVLGAALLAPSGIVGGAMHIAMHAMGKITLFFCAGAIYVATGKTEVSQMDGIGRTMPVTLTAFLIGSLSVIGLPPFGGAWSKYFLALGAMEAGHVVFVAVLMISSLLNVAYLLPVVGRGFFAGRDKEQGKAIM
ncbi:MAG: proton-conducting transporter membrane subunit, partial [Alphaproteobacteria bacterium]